MLCFGLFSVSVFASNEEENLISYNFYNDWQQISDIDSKFDDLNFGSGTYYNSITIPSNVYIPSTSAFVGAAYTLPNLTVGESYELFLPFVFRNPDNLFRVFVGFGFLDSEGYITPFSDSSWVSFAESVGDYINDVNYNFKFTFEYQENPSKGTPCVYVSFLSEENDFTTTFGTQFYLYYTSYLKRLPSPTEQKLDGILGWLEDIKNSIVGLPQTIKTNFQNFFSDLENKINDFKNTVTEKFTTLSTEFSSYITNLGNNIKGFFDDFWNKISEWFEKFKPRINVDLGFQSGALNVSTGEFVFPAGNNYVLSDVIYIPDGVEMHLNYTAINDTVVRYIPVTSKGEYTGRYDQYYTDFELLLDTSRYFRIETRSFATGFIECYVDVGWFTYYMYTLRHKIDVKIEEIKQDLHDLFIPSEGYFDDLSNRFDLLIEERFGALVTITDYLVEFFSSFDADVTKEYFDVPIININLLGYNFPIGGWQVRFVPQFNGVEILTNACKFISSVLATFAFFDGLKNKYHEVFGGGD